MFRRMSRKEVKRKGTERVNIWCLHQTFPFLSFVAYVSSVWGKKFLEMNVTLVHYTGLEPQGDTNTTAPFAWEANEEKKEARLPQNNKKRTNNPEEKWLKAMNRPFTEEPEQSTNSRKRLNSISNQGNAK